MSPFLCVVMPVFRPDQGFLASQIASFAAQDRRPDLVVAVIADRASDALTARLLQEAGLPHHIAIPDTSLDSVSAFQFGLQIALGLTPEDSFIALSDQDDVWHPQRLSAGIAALRGGAMLAHSDARVIDAEGAVRHPSLFRMERRLRNPGLRGLLYRNTVTGMTVTMRRQLVELALPFPRQSGIHFYHDLWLALVAEATGGIILIDRPLVDYRQHGSNAVGAVDRTGKAARRRRLPDMAWVRREAASYALARYLAQTLHHRLTSVLPGSQGGVQPDPRQLRVLRRYARRLQGTASHAADVLRYGLTGRTGLARLAAGQAIVTAGRTVWTLRTALGAGITQASQTFDDRLFSMSPGLPPEGLTATAALNRPMKAADLIDPRKTARFRPVFSAAAPSVTLLVPTLNPTEVFAGIATAVDLGLALAAEGLSVRFIATDLPVASPAVSRQFLIQRLGPAQAASGAADRISLHCGLTEPEIPAHRGDRFIATAWWTALAADRLIATHGFDLHRFVYLIQDYEPGFYAWGSVYADALSSYALDFIPLFNTTLLRDHFADLGHAFAGPEAAAFRPAIDIARYAGQARKGRAEGAPRRIALYGRPEVDRNLFPTAIEALDLFLTRQGLTPDQVQIDSVGLRHAPVSLSNGHRILSRGKLPFEEYPGYLAGVDIGLSLMLSPHPSHPPIEMAAAGARVVTNSYGAKDLSRLSGAILSVPPYPSDLAEALARAWTLPPPSDAERAIDLSPLGQPLETLAASLAPQLLPQPAPPNARRRLILHIGAPKCGSTFLQKVLLQNRDRLAGLGIAYPHDGSSHPGNLADPGVVDADRLLADFGPAHTLIYSHENLISHAVLFHPLAQICRQHGIDAQVLVFLRPFPDMMFGSYSQKLKQEFGTWLDTRTPFDGMDFTAFVQDCAPRYVFGDFLLWWTKVFPDVRAHPSGQIRPVIETLLDAHDLDWSVPPAETNPSLRVEDVERLAALIADPAQSPDVLRAELGRALTMTGKPDAGRTAQRRAQIDDLFRDQINSIVRRFGLDLSSPQQGD